MGSIVSRAVRHGLLALGVGAMVVGSSATVSGAQDGGPVEAGIFVDRIENLPDGFINGVDVSSVLSLEESGVVFRDAAGQPADLFRILADHDVNYVRVRVWNDPFDAAGNGYGGGDTGPDRATEIASRATAAGMEVLVDFHYSDFWADPGKQQAPKAWQGLSPEETAVAVGEHTTAVLEQMAAAGVDVGMVQVGNETNGRVAGLTGWDDLAAVFQAGSAAVRDVYPEAKVAVHVTNPETPGRYAGYAAELDARGVDYDVFASSYYPFWHGTPENLTAVLSDVATTYGKEVMVAETSWVSTLADGDGHQNVIDQAAEADAYPVSVQGQADAVSDVIRAVADVGPAGLGVFYWEPAWLPVGPPEEVEANRVLWERDGSGWATSYAGEYDPVDAGQYFGGSAWENQALFAYDGTPLESLNIFSYVRTGAVAPIEVVGVEAPSIELTVGAAVTLPATVAVTYNDGTVEQQAVTWDDVVDLLVSPGTFTVAGTTAGGLDTVATVVIAPVNHLANPGFEDDDLSMWALSSDAASFGVVTSPGDSLGSRSVNFWSGSPYQLTVSQQVDGLAPGVYTVSAQGHGQSGVEVALDAATSTGTASASMTLAGWLAWRTATIPALEVGADGTVTVTASASPGAGDWGYLDGFVLTPMVPAADTSGLDAALAAAAAVDRDAYTPTTVAALDRSVLRAGVVQAATDPPQGLVDTVTAEVTAALDDLMPLSPACRVDYRILGRWRHGFLAQVKLANLGDQPVRDWTLTWSFAGDERVKRLWGGEVAQVGPAVTVSAEGRRSTLRPGGHHTIGFLGTTATAPLDVEVFRLDGRRCAPAR